MPGPKSKKKGAKQDDVTEFLTYRIHRLNVAMDAQAIAILNAKSSLSQLQWRVLGPICLGLASTARDLAQSTNMDPATISRGVRELELAGLVLTERSQTDRRKVLLHPTDTGRKAVETVLPHMKARQERLLRALEPSERSVIFQIIEKLQTSVEQPMDNI